MNRNVLFVAGAALALGLAATAACSVEVVDDLGVGGTTSVGVGGSSTVGVGGSTATGTGGSTATGMGGAAACLSCAEFIADPMADPASICETSLEVAAALSMCVCTECADAMECGPECDAQTDACSTCQIGAAGSTCKAQFDACANDT